MTPEPTEIILTGKTVKATWDEVEKRCMFQMAVYHSRFNPEASIVRKKERTYQLAKLLTTRARNSLNGAYVTSEGKRWTVGIGDVRQVDNESAVEATVILRNPQPLNDPRVA